MSQEEKQPLLSGGGGGGAAAQSSGPEASGTSEYCSLEDSQQGGRTLTGFAVRWSVFAASFVTRFKDSTSRYVTWLLCHCYGCWRVDWGVTEAGAACR